MIVLVGALVVLSAVLLLGLQISRSIGNRLRDLAVARLPDTLAFAGGGYVRCRRKATAVV